MKKRNLFHLLINIDWLFFDNTSTQCMAILNVVYIRKQISNFVLFFFYLIWNLFSSFLHKESKYVLEFQNKTIIVKQANYLIKKKKKIQREIFGWKRNGESEFEIKTNEELSCLYVEISVIGVITNSSIRRTTYV